MDGGFNQLAVELIAVDKAEDNQEIALLYGAVTLGDIWRFAILDRATKRIIKNMHSHTIPQDTTEVFSILLGILMHNI